MVGVCYSGAGTACLVAGGPLDAAVLVGCIDVHAAGLGSVDEG